MKKIAMNDLADAINRLTKYLGEQPVKKFPGY